MKKKVITVSAVAGGIIILVLFFLWVLLPRIALYKTVKNFLPNVEKSAEYFADFSNVDENNDIISVNNGYVSIKIPDSFIHDEEKADSIPYIYSDTGKKETIFFMPGPDDLSGLNMLDPEKYKDIENIPNDMGIKEITEGFESLGNGIPDSAYNTYKCALLVDKDDYSFWSLKKGTAFSLASIIKELLISTYDEVYLYERDNIRGIIFIEHDRGENGLESVTFEIFNENDLNTAHTLIIGVHSLDDAYAIINSAEFI